MSNINLVEGASDSSVVVEGSQTEGNASEGESKATETKAQVRARLAAIPELLTLVTALTGLTAEQWDYVKSAVGDSRREAKDSATPAGRKLFGPGIEAGSSTVALKFAENSGFGTGLYLVETRETAKGREGKVTMGLRNMADNSLISLNSREHAGIVLTCFAQRANAKGK
jgi:hypothetical protein